MRQRLFNASVVCIVVMVVLFSTLVVSANETYEARTGATYKVAATYSLDFENTSIQELSKNWEFNAKIQATDELNGLDESDTVRPGEWVIADDGGNKVLFQKDEGSIASVALFKGVKAKNFVAEFRMRWLRPDDWGLHTGFVFRNTNYQQFYRVCVLGRFRLWRRTIIPYIGVPTSERIRWGPSGTFDHTPIIGKWLWIRVEAVEDLVTLWYSLDGKEYTLYWDHKDEWAILGEGYFGFFAYGPAMFDDFTLKVLQ